VKGDQLASIERGVERALSIEGVRGVFIVYRGLVGMGGEVPTIIGVGVDDLEGARLSVRLGGVERQ